MTPVILASRSPRRKQLLEQAGVPFTIMAPDVEETWPNGLPLADAPVYIARKKALAAQAALPGNLLPVVAADTVVMLHQRIIGKPANREEAIETLLSLSEQTHEVITGVVLLYQGKETAFSEITRVEFDVISPADAAYYTDRFMPYDKAGAYAIQEWIGLTAIKSIQGDFYNVMGLPVNRLYRILQKI
jgi:septum formation protein